MDATQRRRVCRLVCLATMVTPVVIGCTTVPYTERKQLMLIRTAHEQKLGLNAYRKIIEDAELSDDPRLTALVRRVGERIAAAVNRPDFAWEFNLIEDDQINAFCLPGGKIAVCTGLLPVAENEAALACVLGHEVAHALARHGGERMSQGVATNVLLQGASLGLGAVGVPASGAIMSAMGLGTQVGVLLPFSRLHEAEADHIGLILAAAAGYDPREAVPFWRRMDQASKKHVPVLLSTHPGPDKRIDKLEGLKPMALERYHNASVQFGRGETWSAAAPLAKPANP